MKNLKQIQNKNIEILTINSREVSKMLDIKHKSLLRKIDDVNKDFTEHKIVPSEYWIESSYKDSSGKTNRCYEITKRGCEFIAHKTTGTKGNIFTHRYMEKFEELNQIVNGHKSITVNDANNIISNKLDKAIATIDNKYANYVRPLAVDKVRIARYIKQRLGIKRADEDFYLVKERVLILLDAEKWEDVPVNKLKDAFRLIDESIDVMIKGRNLRQVNWF